MRRSRVFAAVTVVGLLGGLVSPVPARAAGGHTVYTYWDQNEQQDFLTDHGGSGVLVPPYDANGQMCLFPDGSGRFVTGYNPTTDPSNPGYLLPTMQPPVGEAVWDAHGTFTGTTFYVPGPYMLPGQTVGGDIPPDPGGQFNNNGTMTGCVFDRRGNLFASDLGTAQGQYPSPNDGRLIEWFAPDYSSYCIVTGPTAGGVGPHHVDGTGGIRQPGTLALTPEGDLMVTEGGVRSGGLPAGTVVQVDRHSLPHSAADCGPDGLYPAAQLRTSIFFKGSLSLLPFPQGIARDQACNCWAIASTIGNPAIAFFNDAGQLLSSPGEIPGEAISQIGDPNGYNPFGIAFTPTGTAYFADIHLTCTAPLTNCGPANNGGQIMKVTFTNGVPSPPTAVATGLNFPTSVTVCATRLYANCPTPAPSGADSG